MPAESLWSYEIFDFSIVPYDPPTLEGWYDPATGTVIYDDHQAYFQYNINLLDSTMWFWQDSGVVYWLSISANVDDPTGLDPHWGWKSSVDHWNDDAVWRVIGGPIWQELYEPGTGGGVPIVNNFYVVVNEQGFVEEGAGEDAYGDGWYFYDWYSWWNIWFYDHPFDPNRYKTIHLEFNLIPYAPGPSFVEIAVNWSTDQWSLDQPPGDSAPPLPGVDEDLYIGRETVFITDIPEGYYVFDYEIPDYNPEWVSVDIRGYNFIIPDGFIEHACVGQQSLDLSFVITGGTCCDLPGDANNDGTINILDITHLINFVYMGGPPPPCMYEGDANGDCAINILDMTYLIAFLYGTPQGPAPVCATFCPGW
jgi:hypothetical protein